MATRFIITEKAGNKRFRAAKTPIFNTKAEADQYISECPNAFAWKWEAKPI